MLLHISQTPLPDILHDTAFQFIVLAIDTFVAGSIGGIISYWIFRKLRNRKEIAYQISTDSPLVNINDEVRDRITIYLDGKQVTDMSLVSLKVWNSGDATIETKDYIDPIIFMFEGRIVQDVNIRQWEPKHRIKPEDIKKFREDNQMLRLKEPNSVKLPELHLNAKERSGKLNTYTITVLLTGSQGNISLEGTINDGKIIESDPLLEPKISLRKLRILMVIILGLYTVSFVLDIVSYFLSGGLQFLVFALLSILTIILVSLMSLIGVIPSLR